MLCFYPLSSYSSLNCVWIDIPQTWTWKISEPFCSVLVLAILTLYLLGIILIPQFAVSHCTAVYPSPHYICINCLCCPFPFYMFSLMVVCLPALIFLFRSFPVKYQQQGWIWSSFPVSRVLHSHPNPANHTAVYHIQDKSGAAMAQSAQ